LIYVKDTQGRHIYTNPAFHDFMNDTIKILLIEDSPSDADLLQEYLDDIDNLKISMSHVQLLGEAEIILAKENIDVILLDLNLPDASGLDTVKRTYAVAHDVPIVVLSGLIDEDMAVEASKTGRTRLSG
jgi:DNA-binding response OmpR family regulator